MPEDQPQPRRRVRYKGTHPRHFAEKYKELDPARFGAERDKVMARGQTPAGTHRPIMVQEILEVLDPQPGERFLDATLGFGGHASQVLARLGEGGHLWGLDVDPLELPRTEARLREAGYGPEVLTVRRMNFAGLPGLLPETGPFHGILADLGLSSMQIDNPARGFTFKVDAPLDLRLNPQKGRPAWELLRGLREDHLADLLREHADEPLADELAHALVNVARPLRTTREFADIVRAELRARGVPPRDPEERKTLQRCLQALRIAVNDEFGVLDQFLTHLPKALHPGGRVAVLSFHSGEDRRVKKAFQEGLRTGCYDRIAECPQRPSPEERHANPRSAPAKLRWAVRSGVHVRHSSPSTLNLGE